MKIKYIKLGEGGAWEKSCIEKDNTIRLGYESPYHQESLDGKWDIVKQYWLEYRNNKSGPATSDVTQIRSFYELSDSDIWITFYKRKMYWCHAEKEIIKLDDGSRIRKVIGSWLCVDKNNSVLAIENLDGRVTKVQGYRGTICDVSLPEYVIRKINGEEIPEIVSINRSLSILTKDIKLLIEGLWWNDFELLVDLIFSQSGWQRISVLGKTEKDIDLDVFSPVTQKRAFVQVKSATDIEQIRDYYSKFSNYSQYDEMYFVFHTIKGDLDSLNIGDHRLNIWGADRISSLVINAGLIEWLITKRT